MLLSELNKYFSALEKASREIDIIEGNLSVYEYMSSFEGTAKGSEQAAIDYIARVTPRLKDLRLFCEIKGDKKMEKINELLNFLIENFGDQHDVRFVPSVLIGGGCAYRVTVTNIPLYRGFSVKDVSYEDCCADILEQIKDAIATTKRIKDGGYEDYETTS